MAKKAKQVEFMGKYKISADPMNIILQEKQHNKKRNIDYWSNIAYFAKPQEALKYIIDKEIRETWVDDLRLVNKNIDKLYGEIQGLNTNLLPEIVQGSC